VVGTSGHDEKLKRAAKLGLDASLNYRVSPEWAKWVIEETDGVGADLVVEVGGAGTFMQSLKAVRIGGTIAEIGVLSQASEQLDIRPILHKQANLQGIYVGSRSDFEEMNKAIHQHKLQPVVDEVFTFDNAKDALRKMEIGSHFGKLVIRVR
jgi:NADPH:quinone reductase-like Zn-dependent oxidoreductase